MHSDERYGHQLGVRLRDDIDDVRAAPDLVVRLRRRRARRTWAIRAAIATPVAAAAVAAGLVAAAGDQAPVGGPGPQIAESTPSDPVRLENVAYVRAQTIEALTRAPSYVIYSKTTYSTGYYETWTDKSTRRYRNDVYTSLVDQPTGGGTAPRLPDPGAPPTGPMRLQQSHSASGPYERRTITVIDYDRRTWSVERTSERPPRSEVPDITDADSVRAATEDGKLELLGRETVNGQDTLHLRIYARVRGYRVDMWVDRQTFLPVQEAQSTIDDGQTRVTTTYAWLPRTRANLARLVLTPPPGFVRQ